MLQTIEKKVYNGLNIKDADFAIKKEILEAPTKILTREFIQNTMECEEVTKVCIGEIEVKGFNEKKFYIINNGKGMNLTSISKLRDVYGSDKNIERRLDGNNNTGARIISLKANLLGTIFVSKCNGEINGCIFTRDNQYNVDFNIIDSSKKHFTGYTSDKYNILKDYSYLLGEDKLDQDWTIVITLGNQKNQNTFLKPDFFSKDDSENYIEELMLNRYYQKANTYKDDSKKIEFFIKDQKVEFTKDLIANVKGQSWEFTSPLAKYEVKHSENWGKIIPKSFIVYQNEMFEVVSQGYQNNPFIDNSSSFMRDLGAINLRDNLSIVITPLKSKDFTMNHLRDQLRYNSLEKNEQVKLSHFIDDFKTHADSSLKKMIEDSNKNKNFGSISKELMDELIQNLIESDVDLEGKSKKYQKKNKTKKNEDNIQEIETIEEKEKNFLYLLEEYPLIRYNVKQIAIEKNLSEEDLKERVREFIKYSRKQFNKIKKNELTDVLDTLKLLLNKSDSLSIKSVYNVLNDLTTIKVNVITNEEKLIDYTNLLLYFLEELKQDLGDNKVEDLNGVDNHHNINMIKPLDVDLLSKKDWITIFKDIEDLEENKDKKCFDYFAIYSKRNVSINIEHKFFKRLKEDFIEDYLRKNLIEDISYLEDGFETKIKTIMGYLCAYYTMFNFIVEEDLVLKENDSIDLNAYINYLTAEHMLSSKLEISRVIERELKNSIL